MRTPQVAVLVGRHAGALPDVQVHPSAVAPAVRESAGDGGASAPDHLCGWVGPEGRGEVRPADLVETMVALYALDEASALRPLDKACHSGGELYGVLCRDLHIKNLLLEPEGPILQPEACAVHAGLTDGST